MKKGLLCWVLLVGLAGSAFADPGEVHVFKQDNGRQISLPAGKVLVVNLESTPATGFGWYVKNLQSGKLRQVDSAWTSNQPGTPGVAGMSQLRFQGVAAGQVPLQLVHVRPWENVPVDSFSIGVDVAGPASGMGSSSAGLGGSQTPPTSVALSLADGSWSWCDGTNDLGLRACSPVRDQGYCGSCWAFGTVGPVETAIQIFGGQSRDLSEQYLVSCNVENWGCNGGWWAHDYFVVDSGKPSPGARWESEYPYTSGAYGDDGACYERPIHEFIRGWSEVDGSVAVPSVESIQNAIMSFGPVSAAVCVDSNFQQYAGGVFKPKKPCNSVNHAIVLVGWDEPNNAWILRNSWGDSWGEGGYMRIDYSKSKVGYAAVYVNYNCANSDADNDGYDSPICGGDDCDDANASVNPGVANDPCNGVDDDCDGQVDEDCSCGPSGSYCTSKADCCSNRCKRNTCR